MDITPPFTRTLTKTRNFYIRQDKDNPTILLGPVDERTVWSQAMAISTDPQYQCTCQVYTYVGEREGEDFGLPHMQVVAVYVNGKMIFGGWKADRYAKLGVAYDTSRRVGK